MPLHAQEDTDGERQQFFLEGLTEEQQQIIQEELPDELQLTEIEDIISDLQSFLPAELTSEQQRTDLEIRTSSLSELAAWSRSLGLSESGSREALTDRLRNYFRIQVSGELPDEDNRKILTIESARTTEYFRIDVVDEEYARLSGEVRLTLIESDSVHRINASEILFNRTRNIITARGGVEYIKEKEGTIETFRGENITVDLDNWSSVFLDGTSERKLESDGTTYRFSGTVISRNDEEVVVLSKASISNASNTEALWSIDATRVWLLPGSDFAIFNAVLKVGEIPVLYIPFFYFPADEVIFHPVLGFRSREGTFVQTTTYILGRPQSNPSSQSSLSRILGSSRDSEKTREGLFLRSTGRRSRDPNTTSLKAMIDYYANLGAYFGLDLATPRLGVLNSLDLSLGFGVSRTVSQIGGGNYTPYAPDFDGSSDWNRTNLFSMDVPFRYRFRTQSSVNGRYGNLTWNFPYYSDPYVDYDFLNRSEEMDWMNMIQQGAALEEQNTASQSEIHSYSWQLSGRPSFSFTKLSPYISNISLNSFTSTVAFRTITLSPNDPNFNRDSPSRAFFAPDRYTIYSVSGSASGAPLRFDSSGQSRMVNPPNRDQDQELENPLENIGIPISPWESVDDNEESESSPENILTPPVLDQRFELPRTGNVIFGIDYQFSPTSSSELQFRISEWKTYDEVDWSQVQSILSTFGGNSSINFTANHGESLYSNTFSLSGSGSWRQYSYLDEEAEVYQTGGQTDKSKIEQANRQQYSQSFYSTSYSNSFTLRPLYRNIIFSQSNLQYSFRGLLARSNFIGTGDDPEWENVFGAWEKEKLEGHSFSTNLSANIMDKVQSLSLSSTLPPFDPTIAANATFRVWISDTSASISITNPGESEKRKILPFSVTETLRFGSFGSFVHSMTLDPELNNEFTSITTTLSLWNLRIAYTATRMAGYELRYDSGMPQGWVALNTEPALKSKDVSLSYSKSFQRIEIIKDLFNISVNFNTRLFYDLQRYSSSSFTFSLGLNIGISNFMNLSLSTSSENAVIFRYFKEMPGMEDLTSMYPEGDQNNLFIDLFDSFNFADETKRRRSGFKTKSFNLSATHQLGDWNAVLGITVSPYLPAGSRSYDVSTDVSFLVQWVPISEIKSDIKYENRTHTYLVK